MSLLSDAHGYVLEQARATGLPVTGDPRNVTLPGVLVEPPTIEAYGGNAARLRFPIVVMVPPPGNADAVRRLLEMADRLLEAVDNVTGGEPTTYGEKDLPSYLLTCTVTVRRDTP